MNILNRQELVQLYQNNPDFIIGNSRLDAFASAVHGRDNPFQPCSIDIHVGEVFVPGSGAEEKGGSLNPIRGEHALAPGSTIMIRTLEKLKLPLNVGALCFSPSRLALKAILITNTGHVDPGYDGHLHFAAINMGNSYYSFRREDVIITMLFFKLTSAGPAYGKENSTEITHNGRQVEVPSVIDRYFPMLSEDFLTIEKRARDVSKEEIDKAEYKLKRAGAIAGAVATLLVILIPTLNNIFVNRPVEKKIDQAEQKIQQLETKLDLDRRLYKLENESTTQPGE